MAIEKAFALWQICVFHVNVVIVSEKIVCCRWWRRDGRVLGGRQVPRRGMWRKFLRLMLVAVVMMRLLYRPHSESQDELWSVGVGVLRLLYVLLGGGHLAGTNAT